MLTLKRLATCSTRGGSQQMYITFASVMQIIQNPPQLLRGDITRKHGYQWPQNRTRVRQKHFEKAKVSVRWLLANTLLKPDKQQLPVFRSGCRAKVSHKSRKAYNRCWCCFTLNRPLDCSAWNDPFVFHLQLSKQCHQNPIVSCCWEVRTFCRGTNQKNDVGIAWCFVTTSV